MLCYVPVVFICGTGATGVATAVVAGAGLALLPDDLREHLMLGDTGANVLGAVLGLAVVLEDRASNTRHRRDRPVRRQPRVRVRVVQWCHRARAAVACVRRPRSGRFGVKRFIALLVLLLVGAGVFAAPHGVLDAPASAATDPPPIRRVFVFSMPGVTWSELDTVDLPNLEGFLAGSALASLAPAHVVAHRPGAADAYVTFGAGHAVWGCPASTAISSTPRRWSATSPPAKCSSAAPDSDPKSGIVSLGFPSLRRENAALPYDIELGAVADQLAQHDVDRAVIANADGVDGPGSDDRHREAALALVDGTGVVENGQVGNVLLTPDPAAPFGVKLDTNRVVDAFDKAWDKGDKRGVVLVEASDLARLRRYMRFTTAEQFVSLRTTALRDADAMFGRLLAQVDPDRDAVMVVGPSEGRRKLTVTALRTPGSSPGYIRTASSQHDGVAIAVDVGPTLLDLFGIDFTDKMEGRPYEIVPSNSVSRLAPNSSSRKRGIGAARRATGPDDRDPRRAHRDRRPRHGARRRGGRERVAPPPPRARVGRAVLAGDAAEHAARPVDTGWHRGLRRLPPGRGRNSRGHRDGRVVPAPSVRSDDRHARVHARRDPRRRHDRSHMHYNAVFGYSPTANSRLYGISNYSFGVVVTSTILLATFIIVFARTRFAFALAMALMGFVLVVEGLPAWGSDVGGVLAGVPTFLLFMLLVRNRRIRCERSCWPYS